MELTGRWRSEESLICHQDVARKCLGKLMRSISSRLRGPHSNERLLLLLLRLRRRRRRRRRFCFDCERIIT